MAENRFHHNSQENDLPQHYSTREISPVWGIVSTVIALAILAFAVAEVRQIANSQPALTFSTMGGHVPEGVPVLRVTGTDWRLNGQQVEINDRLFRLSGAAARSQVIVVEYPTTLPAGHLNDALELVNRAGYTQVGLKGLERGDSPVAADSEETTGT